MNIFSIKSLVIVVIIIVISVFILYQRGFFETENLSLAMVDTDTYQETVTATGNITSRGDIIITAEEEGTVRVVNYTPGDTVTRGAILAQLENETLRVELDIQQSLLDREIEKLRGLNSGPEENERDRIVANNRLVTQALENQSQIAIVSMQKTAGVLEDAVRRELDELFNYDDNSFYFKGTVSTREEASLNLGREQLEELFSKWRAVPNTPMNTPEEVIKQLEEFGVDLQQVNNVLSRAYEVFVSRKFNSEEESVGFMKIASARASVLNEIVANTQTVNNLRSKLAEWTLSYAQTKELLSGGTNLNRKTQQALVDAERARLITLQTRFEKTNIRAPFDGVIGEIFVEQGEFIKRGTDALRFISKEGFEVQVNVTEVEIPHILIGEKMEAYVDALDMIVEVATRTIDATEKKINEVPVYTVLFDVFDAPQKLRTGMTADVHIPVGEKKTLTVVPVGSVQTIKDGKYVRVVNGDQEQQVPVTLGPSPRSGVVSVVGDIRPGDTVVVDNNATQ